MEKVVQYILDHDEENGRVNSSLLKGIQLAGCQADRKFLAGGGFRPKDELYQLCAFCGHNAVDEPEDNAEVTKRNEEKMKEERELIRQWEKHVSNWNKFPSPMTKQGTPYTMRPKGAAKEKKILQCHCFQMQCMQQGTNHGSTCLFLCLDNNGIRFPWSKEKCCTCPICRCQCNKAYYYDDVPAIADAKLKIGNDSDEKNEEQRRVKEEEARSAAMRWLDSHANIARVTRDTTSKTFDKMKEKGEQASPFLFVSALPPIICF